MSNLGEIKVQEELYLTCQLTLSKELLCQGEMIWKVCHMLLFTWQKEVYRGVD